MPDQQQGARFRERWNPLRKRRSIGLSPAGVAELFHRPPPRLTPWSEVLEVVDVGQSGPVLRLQDREIVTDLQPADRDRFRELARDLMAKHGRVRPIHAAELEAWLGVGPGGVLTYEVEGSFEPRAEVYGRAMVWSTALLMLGSLLLLSGIFAAGSAGLERLVGGIGLALVGFAIGSPRLFSGRETIRADAWGIWLQRGRRRRHIEWDELEHIECHAASEVGPFGEWWEVEAASGKFNLDSRCPGARRLAGAILQSLRAQRQGRLLATPEELPEGALSVAEKAASDSDQRGLSRAE